MSTALKYITAARAVRAQIEDGTLKLGDFAPSGAELARATGFGKRTCRKALHMLIRDGLLVPGPSPNSRARVAGPRPEGPAESIARQMSAALAARRHAAGLTQSGLGSLIGYSVTTVGHAETGRAWQSREFWEVADAALGAGGELLRLCDRHREAAAPGVPARPG